MTLMFENSLFLKVWNTGRLTAFIVSVCTCWISVSVRIHGGFESRKQKCVQLCPGEKHFTGDDLWSVWPYIRDGWASVCVCVRSVKS